MSNVAPRGVPSLPWLSAFPELNVRTYVTRDQRPGVYFFSLEAGNPVAVYAARLTIAGINGLSLPAAPELLHFVTRQDMVAWPPERLP